MSLCVLPLPGGAGHTTFVGQLVWDGNGFGAVFSIHESRF
jgi:hypothetical protein